LVGNELESECVQQYKESENCEYENNEENEEGFESKEPCHYVFLLSNH